MDYNERQRKIMDLENEVYCLKEYLKLNQQRLAKAAEDLLTLRNTHNRLSIGLTDEQVQDAIKWVERWDGQLVQFQLLDGLKPYYTAIKELQRQMGK